MVAPSRSLRRRRVGAHAPPMTLPRVGGLREYGNRGPPRTATDRADAGQSPGEGARRGRGVVLRAEVGRFPGAGFPRRRRDRPAVPQWQGPRPVLPGTARRAARRVGAALCARRRSRRPPRDRGPHAAGLGIAEPAHPPRRQPHQDAFRGDPCALHRFRRAGHRGHVTAEGAVPGPPRGAGRGGERQDSGAMSPAPPRTPSWARSG